MKINPQGVGSNPNWFCRVPSSRPRLLVMRLHERILEGSLKFLASLNSNWTSIKVFSQRSCILKISKGKDNSSINNSKEKLYIMKMSIPSPNGSKRSNLISSSRTLCFIGRFGSVVLRVLVRVSECNIDEIRWIE